MSSYVNSMLKLILEEQEKGIDWSPPSYQRDYEPSTSREYQPCGYYAQGSQCNESERYHPWNKECEDQEYNSSQVSKEEEIHNLLKELLEEQERTRIEITRFSDSLCTKLEVTAKHFGSKKEDEMTHMEYTNTRILPRNEDREEMYLPLEQSPFQEEDQSKDRFPIDVEETKREFESTLGCTVDKDLVISYGDEVKTVEIPSDSFYNIKEVRGLVGKNLEDHLEDVLVTECGKQNDEISIDLNETSSIKEVILNDIQEEEEESINEFEALFGYPSMEAMNAKFEDDAKNEWKSSIKEEPYVIFLAKKEVKEEEPKEKDDENDEEPPQRVREEESPIHKPLDKDLGIISTKVVSIDSPKRLLFEEIRMKTFKGWFYDEYEPGDSRLLQREPQNKVKLRDLKQAL